MCLYVQDTPTSNTQIDSTLSEVGQRYIGIHEDLDGCHKYPAISLPKNVMYYINASLCGDKLSTCETKLNRVKKQTKSRAYSSIRTKTFAIAPKTVTKGATDREHSFPPSMRAQKRQQNFTASSRVDSFNHCVFAPR